MLLPDCQHCFCFPPLCAPPVPGECHPDCVSCSQASDHCDSCRDPRKRLQDGRCMEKCAQGFYQHGGACLGNFCKGLDPPPFSAACCTFGCGIPRVPSKEIARLWWEKHPGTCCVATMRLREVFLNSLAKVRQNCLIFVRSGGVFLHQ